jgi:DNA (cytosine-5)-methyltransferase 1
VISHIDLFTGLGGFTLAAHATGIKTVVMCESDEYRRGGLHQAWPGIPIIDDAREFDGKKWADAFILTAGVPCQPASRAGQQRGQADDRWLWPEALRIVAEAKPRWCLFENPPGILDVGLDGILTDLEALGYETGITDIPACAVNAPHIRHRLWIMAHATALRYQKRRGPGEVVTGQDAREQGATLTESIESDMADPRRFGSGKNEPWGKSEAGIIDRRNSEGDVADMQGRHDWKSNPSTSERPIQQPGVGDGKSHMACNQHDGLWNQYLWTPCADGKVRRTPDNTFSLVDGLPRKILAALGDSIVWPVAAEIMRAIRIASN